MGQKEGEEVSDATDIPALIAEAKAAASHRDYLDRPTDHADLLDRLAAALEAQQPVMEAAVAWLYDDGLYTDRLEGRLIDALEAWRGDAP